MSKFDQKMKAIIRNYKAKRAEERFKCYCCKVIHDSGWAYETEDGTICFCHGCKNKYALGKMNHSRMVLDGNFEQNK